MPNVALLQQSNRQLVRFARLLAGYGCAGVGLEPDDTQLCGQCAPCEARIWLETRGLLEPKPLPMPNSREREVLLEVPGKWIRPMDVGGSDGNDVSRVLMALVRKGYVEMKERAGHCRPSYLYRRAEQ